VSFLTTSKIQAMLLSLEQLQALPRDPPTSGGSIYFLWSGESLVYVGQSNNVCERLSGHDRARRGFRTGKQIPFEWHTFILWDHLQVEDLEYAYIRQYRPTFNSKVLG
jgi:excinuclease UvrABC nuclease subunit